MKNMVEWRPSKFVYRRGKLAASRDTNEVDVASRLVASRVAHLYDLYIKDHCTGRLIDLGCGKAPFYEAYREYVDDVTCVDWPNSPHGVSYVDFECDLTAPLPFRSGEFNTIILSDVLEHIPTPDALVSEMSRILVCGGKCLLNVPFYYWLHEDPHDYYRYTEHALRRFAALHRFKVLVLEPYGGAPEILADVLAKIVNRVPLVGPPTAIIIQGVVQLALATRVGRQVSRNTAKRFPWGYFMIIEKSSVTDSSDE